jgi:DNA-binding FadR family transcriptional regulator
MTVREKVGSRALASQPAATVAGSQNADPAVPSKVLKQHRGMYKAIKARDAAAARDTMWEHLEETAQLLRQLVQKRGKPARNGRVRRSAE